MRSLAFKILHKYMGWEGGTVIIAPVKPRVLCRHVGPQLIISALNPCFHLWQELLRFSQICKVVGRQRDRHVETSLFYHLREFLKFALIKMCL